MNVLKHSKQKYLRRKLKNKKAFKERFSEFNSGKF